MSPEASVRIPILLCWPADKQWAWLAVFDGVEVKKATLTSRSVKLRLRQNVQLRTIPRKSAMRVDDNIGSTQHKQDSVVRTHYGLAG